MKLQGYDFVAELRKENQDGKPRVPLKESTTINGMILADAWAENEMKTRIIQSCQKKKFCKGKAKVKK